jgi:hypothetical protein
MPAPPPRLADRLLRRPWIALTAHTALWFAVQRDLGAVDPLYCEAAP